MENASNNEESNSSLSNMQEASRSQNASQEKVVSAEPNCLEEKTSSNETTSSKEIAAASSNEAKAKELTKTDLASSNETEAKELTKTNLSGGTHPSCMQSPTVSEVALERGTSMQPTGGEFPFAEIELGIMPLPSLDSNNAALPLHRSGIPGAFGVGDVTSFQQELIRERREDQQTTIHDHLLEDADNLISAQPVSEHTEETIPHAIPDLGNSNPKRDNNFVLKVVLGVLCLSIAVAVVTAGVCGSGICNTAEDDTKSAAFTMAPTTYRETLREDFKERIAEVVGSNYFSPEDPKFEEARLKALDWILHVDPMQLELDAENLIQRYLLVLFYYQTTSDHPWKNCNPPGNSKSEFCFHALVRGEHQEMLAHRWLSDSHECSWAGVLCRGQDLMDVEQILMVDNELHGQLPTELAQLTCLLRLDLSGNELTGTLPLGLTGLKMLTLLNLAYNFLEGTIPAEYFQAFDSLRLINLSANKLSGTIPPPTIKSFDFIWITHNILTGTVPGAAFNSTTLEGLGLGGNRLTGTLPTTIGLMTKLKWLVLIENSFSGTLPSEIFQFKNNLETFLISSNKFSGTLPEELYTSRFGAFGYAALSDCNFTGTISTQIGRLSDLQQLDISNNNFHGSLPSELAALTNLRELKVNGNDLTGAIPSSVCSDVTSIHADCWPEEATGIVKVDCPLTCCEECCDQSDGVCHSMP